MSTQHLGESITHLEDLDLPAFMQAVQNVARFRATEKLDGAELYAGLDEEGRFFTSRAGKNSTAPRVYEEKDYPYFSANNGFRAAHAALKQKESELKSVLRPGDTVELEVLYGRQPNAVTYGADGQNYIAFLRGVEGTSPSITDQLVKKFANQAVQVKVDMVNTTDGEQLQLQTVTADFRFVGAQHLDTSKIKLDDVKTKLDDLQTYLEKKSAAGLTNLEILTTPLNSIDKNRRVQVKALRPEVENHVLSDFKLPIKKELLARLSRRSPLAATNISPNEDIGIEGVVLLDPDTGDQIKLVDKDTFTILNQFNHAIRRSITGVVKTTDPEASDEARGGITGELKILLADLLGNKDLARSAVAKKALASVKGRTVVETTANLAKQLSGGDDYRSTKRKVLALVGASRTKLAQALKNFKDNRDKLKLKLKDGRTIGYSDEVTRRTLLVFAETKRDLDELAEKVGRSQRHEQLINLLYGRLAKVVHEAPAKKEDLAEELLTEKRHTTDKTLYKGKDAWLLLNSYIATYLQAAVIFKEHDGQGIRLLKDKTHSRLTRWDKEMSALNFWGYPIWRSGTPAVRKLIGRKAADEIFKHARHCPPAHWKFLHIDLAYGKELPIEWNDHRKAFEFLQRVPGFATDRLNMLLGAIMRYDTLVHDEKIKFHNALFYYCQQFIPSSPLGHRVRALHAALLAPPTTDEVVMEQTLLQKVAETADGAATSASAVAAYPTPIMGNGRIIHRVKRNPDINRYRFPKPKKSSSGQALTLVKETDTLASSTQRLGKTMRPWSLWFNETDSDRLMETLQSLGNARLAVVDEDDQLLLKVTLVPEPRVSKLGVKHVISVLESAGISAPVRHVEERR